MNIKHIKKNLDQPRTLFFSGYFSKILQGINRTFAKRKTFVIGVFIGILRSLKQLFFKTEAATRGVL